MTVVILSRRMYQSRLEPLVLHLSDLGLDRNAVQTVLLAILILCLFGIVCSLTTKALHRVVLWFAPINGEAQYKTAL